MIEKGMLLILLLVGSFYSYSVNKECETADSDILKKVNEAIQKTTVTPTQSQNNEILDDPIAKFLENLPLEMKTNVLFLGESRSNQEGSPENPKVIMKSPNSEIIMSFTSSKDGSHSSGKGHHGDNEVEMMIWNEENQEYDMQSLKFGANGRAQIVSDIDNSHCKDCHGEKKRPLWDPAPFWFGQIPPTGDWQPFSSTETDKSKQLLGDVYRSKFYLEELKNFKAVDEKKIEAAGGKQFVARMSKLYPSQATGGGTFFKDITKFDEDIVAAEKKWLEENRLSFEMSSPNSTITPKLDDLKQINPKLDIEFKSIGMGRNGTASTMFSDFQKKNFCTISDELSENSKFKDVEHGVAWLMKKDCQATPEEFAEVISEKQKKAIISYYSATNRTLNDLLTSESTLKKKWNSDVFQEGTSGDTNAKFDLLVSWVTEDTKRRQESLSIERTQRHALYTKNKLGGNFSESDLRQGAFNSLDREQDDPINTKFSMMRLLLEPLGVKMDEWSMSIDKNNLTFGKNLKSNKPMLDNFENLEVLQSAYSDAGPTDTCQNLKKLATKNLSISSFIDHIGGNEKATCDKLIDQENTPLSDINGMMKFLLKESNRDCAVARDKLADEILKSKCAACHGQKMGEKGIEDKSKGYGLYVGSASDLKKSIMDSDIKQDGNSFFADWVVDRVSRPATARGVMPPRDKAYLYHVSIEEKEFLVEYIRDIKEGNGQEKLVNENLSKGCK